MLLRRLQHSGGSSSNKAKAPAPAPSAFSCSPSTSNPTLIGFTRQPTTTATSSATRTWLLPLLCLAIVAHVSGEIDRTIQEHENKNVVLPCPVNEEKCGKLHSLNWFKGDGRIAAMLLGDSNVTSVNDEFKNRVTVEQNPYRLVIKDLRISDEDIYLCDTTFYIPEETCDNFNGYRVELRVLVPPTEVVILDAKGDRIENGSIVGPMQERQNLKATCTVKNTRPQPDVGWWRGNKRLATYSPTHDQNDGLYTSTLELDWQLSREDLGEDIECRVESAAIKNTIVTKFGVDLQVRPTSIDIKGVEHHTVQGSKVVLTCDIHGARPAVNLTWYNSTSTISPEENELTEIRTKAFEKSDGTYHTQSELIFNASRFENDRVFRCEAENIVLQINREKPISSDLTLEVMYPPVVKVSPLERVANTSEMVLLNCEYVANPASLTQVVWYRNGDVVNVNDTNRYEGGNAENVALLIRATEKEDIGNYTCQLSNSIGKTISEQQIDLDVQYVPIVEVLMLPEGPVKESDESNVTLTCNIIDANPSVLTKVRWYANSTLLKELPDCYETREDLCHIDPSKLLLESIGRGFFYNYSCEGYNAAGWGPRSEDKELMVHYEPGPATLSHFPPIAIKKKSVIFYCGVEDPGYPESNRYRWMRGGRGPLQDIVTKEWTVEPVGLDSRTNYSCYAYNEGGKGVMATVNLEVHAPPFFIKNMQPYTGVLHSVSNFNLTCRIECVPRCEIAWWKDGVPIDKNDSRYFVREKYMDASPATGDFESMFSVLHFNMSNFPNKKFDIESDNAKYMCISTANAVGPTVNSTTYLSIEYAPDDISVSESTVYVQEHHIPGRVICKSQANPEPSYEWLYPNKTVTMGNTLIINDPIKRNDTGIYTCRAFNKHGDRTTETRIDVQFTPRCEIERLEIDDQDTLICTADGNPDEADFSWSVKLENDTEALGGGDKKSFKNRSYYVLTGESDIARTYRCLANNTVGPGAVCEIEVAAGSALYLWWQEQLVWWQRWDKTMLYIVISAIALLLLAVIIICIIIICICRRRRRQDKLHDKSSSLGDPLTEPGEYENLPFHGLQTAPNKFSTTPTNFNNNTNVVRVAPRPKRLNGNIGQAMNNPQQMHHQTLQHPQQQQHFYDQQQQQQLQQQQQQHQQQLQYNTLQYGRGCTAPPPHNRSMDQLESSSDQIQYNLSNCFPKSYTEYYQQHHHQQQQQQQQQSQQQQPQTSQQQSQKFHTNSASNAQLLNAIEHDYQPTYAVVERLPPPPPAPSSALLNTNPFLAASNFKKYDAAGQEELLGSMQRGKRGKAASLLDRMDMDKKFYSLKFPNGGGGNNKLKKPAYNLNASLATATANATSTAPKCKRHHSFAGGSHGDIESNGKPMRLYDPPVYENVADKCNGDTLDNEMGDDGSSNILNAGSNLNLSLNQNLATVQLHTQPTAAVVSQSHKKKHHHRQHQQKADAQAGAVGADFQLMEPERLSIYRSDSGISNSSYESQLPALGQRTPKSHKASSSGLNLTRKPVYMNVEGQQQQQQQHQQQMAARAGSPAHNINSSYESASSAPVTDPTSLSSCNSLYSSGTGTVSVSNTRCNRHPASHHQQQQQQQQQHQHQKQPTPEITTPEDYEQYQLGHQPGHSASMLSVASSISAASRGKCKPSASTTAATSALQLQQQQQLSQRMGPHESNQLLANNPFLALKRHNNSNCNSSSNNNNSVACSKKLRRQTISDPYAHIKRYYAIDAEAPNANSNNNNGNFDEAVGANSHCCTAAAATSAAAAAAATQQISSNNNGRRAEHGQRGCGHHQQQMLMPNELQLQASRLAATSNSNSSANANSNSNSNASNVDGNQNLRYVPPMPSATQPVAGGAYDCLVVRRPMRLPLRKHHTFHFQTTQTANGKLQQLRRQLQQQQLEREQQQLELGPLIYRPLALSERHAFKPISPTPATPGTTAAAATNALPDYEKRKENATQQQQQQLQPMALQLNPAASLEALEVLTKTHPDFMFTRPKKEQNTATTAATVAGEAEEEEDLGYSFCEEEYMVDDDNGNSNDNVVDEQLVDEEDEEEEAPHNATAPPTTPAHSNNNNSAAIANATAGALRYFMTQSYREVHI
ncbi:uncharacterized protein LOC117569553 isoform X4 [Drosophila albomicans]|uniref:Uncharacterized protein LOC117569553 isoform X4 n=1 Tax=Drosophila albomicans TaxID=7291 RepID=A0A6P8X4H4_DROAB|nr:uncharacterized protein LOC117569553 isoform X4 [Drosophila albomicans]